MVLFAPRCKTATATFSSTNFKTTEIAQLRLLELLANDSKNIFASAQRPAIYRFRGASFGSFKLFLERFAGSRRR